MKNKIVFSTGRAKWFLFAIAFIAVGVSVYFLMGYKQQKIARSKIDSTTNLTVQSDKEQADADSSKVFYPNLSSRNGVYVLSKSAAPCGDYQNTTRSSIFSFRCKTLRALYRGLWTKTIDVDGYNKLRIEANIKVKNHTDNYFAECNYRGVNSNNSVDLVALSSDPNPKLKAECNHELGEHMWHHCLITNKDDSAITHCGIPQCTLSKKCDMEIDVSNKKEIYLLFSVFDDWFADVEGILSNVKITLTK
ncbi:hypothetical protein ACFL29_00035 [Patescibacteria group bacterium]